MPIAITAESSEHRWGVETVYGTAATAQRRFGTGTEATWDTMPTIIDIVQAGSRILDDFGEGTDKTTISTTWSMTSPWFWYLILGTASFTAASGTTPASIAFSRKSTPIAYTHEIRVDGTDAGTGTGAVNIGTDFKHTLRGCVVNSAEIRCAINETATVTVNSESGNTTLANTTYADFPADTNPDNFVYTFKHGSVTVDDSGTTAELAQVKDFSIRIETGQTQEYGMGSGSAQSGIAGALRITGNFRKILANAVLLDACLKFKQYTNITFKFDNGKTDQENRSITITCVGAILSKHGYSSVQTNRLDDMIDFRAKDITVTCNTGATAQLR